MSIFPIIRELELPLTFEEETSNVGYGDDYAFDFKKGEFILENGLPKKVNGKAAVALWIEKIVRTQKDKWKIYHMTNYGVNLEDLIFSHSYPLEFVQMEVERELSEALLEHPEIKSLKNWKFKIEDEVLKVEFTVLLENEEIIEKEVLFGGYGFL